MTPQTRASRATKEPASSATNNTKTYKSAPSAKEKQKLFPNRRRTIKTYGKPHRSAQANLFRQQTITQMIDPLPDVDPEDDIYDMSLPEIGGPNAGEPSKKRRKTLGDSPNPPPKAKKTPTEPSSSFHTQTITQFVRDRAISIEDSQDEDGGFDFIETDIDSPVKLDTKDKDDAAFSGLPRPKTPSKRTTKMEIPASDESTQSIFSLMLDRYSPPNIRSSPSQLRSSRRKNGNSQATRIQSQGHSAPQTKTPERNITRVEIPPSDQSLATPGGHFDDADVDMDDVGCDSPLAGRTSQSIHKRHVEREDGEPKTPSRSQTHLEVPSSILSSVPSAMLDRYSPPGEPRSPLQAKSPNVASQPSSSTRAGKRPRTLVIEDTFSPRGSPILKSAMETPSKKAPAKKTRFALPTQEEQDEEQVEDSQKGSLVLGDEDDADDVSCPVSPSPKPRQRVKISKAMVIPDSEDEDGWDDETQSQTSLPRKSEERESTPRKEQEEVEVVQKDRVVQEEEVAEENYGDIGAETQAFVDKAISSSEQAALAQLTAPKPNSLLSIVASSPPVSRREASSNMSNLTNLSSKSFMSQPDSLPQNLPPTRRMKPKPIQGTQFESQRLPMDMIRHMAPRKLHRADVFISIHPQYVDYIVDSTKNHEFRNYRFPPTVSRLWIYATRPTCELRYMAHVSEAKQPGQISLKRGLGNAEFNAGQGSQFAYEIIQVYELNNPVSLAEMKEEGWINAPPQKYTYVPPAVLAQLVGNLRRELFEERAQEDDEIDMTISQEAEAQIRSDIEHNTQGDLLPREVPTMVSPSTLSSPQLPTNAPSKKVEAVIIASSPKAAEPSHQTTPRPLSELSVVEETPLASRRPAPPAPTVDNDVGNDYNDARNDYDDEEVIKETPRALQRHVMLRPSQATTASQPSSPTQSLPKSRGRGAPIPISSSVPPSADDLDTSPLRLRPAQFSHSSPGLLSKSQMLPDSLAMDMVQEIGDSEQEGSDFE